VNPVIATHGISIRLGKQMVLHDVSVTNTAIRMIMRSLKMLDDFLVRAALAGLGVALASAPLGCFVVWPRMAYFGEATAIPQFWAWHWHWAFNCP